MTTLKSGSSVETAAVEADLKTLIHLIKTNWKFDVSSQACNDLNLKKWNKITIVPLAKDLKLLKNYLCEKSKSAASKLIESETSNIEAYNTLTETVYCRVLLLNRRRPGELQRLPLSIYQESSNDKSAYEEFDRAISSAEKVLVLKKYATASGARNPAAITTTKLRKHLATLTQMFNLKESDIEQLANFMGHTQAVHRQNYRLPDDVYQTAKLSKLLLLMESGKADSYRGKCLDDINLDLEQDLLENAQGHDNYDSDELIDYDAALPTEKSKETEFTDDNPVLTPQSTLLSDATNATHIKTKKKRNLVPWTTEQKSIVKKFFSKHIKNKQPPKRHECEELRSQHTEILHNKDWLKIKVFVQNAYTNNK
ncbi:unnamed protein product [Parnassius apollo]|uniref:(apollo) hypothetical protein n=1 Tax=Parnassius apollo TaxID=110799 RepID=A0A8S3XQN3_PARAO|nr:unnamed protein product [Parnassius apollo]